MSRPIRNHIRSNRESLGTYRSQVAAKGHAQIERKIDDYLRIVFRSDATVELNYDAPTSSGKFIHLTLLQVLRLSKVFPVVILSTVAYLNISTSFGLKQMFTRRLVCAEYS